ncbi:putative nucleic acid-binding Zn-ribbon protein [Skermanella aerolata]|uniref:hypothetical protein n=1 Tax=Skermanella aerolata TaxID=393310 RepID=UPI003D2429A3
MGIHLHASTWAALGNRQLDHELSSPIIAGRTFLAICSPTREKMRGRMSAQDVSADDTSTFFASLVSDATAEINTDSDRLAAETKSYRTIIAKDLKSAAENADAATIFGTIAEINDLIARPESVEVRKAQSLIDDLEDAIDNYGDDTDFDLAPLNAALDAFNKAITDRAKKLDDLRELAQQAQALLEAARDPATLRRIREAGREVAVRGIVASLAEEMRSARQEAAAAVTRIDIVLATLEAVQ